MSLAANRRRSLHKNTKYVLSCKFFTVASSDHDLRGHEFKLYKQSSYLIVEISSPNSQRFLNEWNRLPSHVVEAAFRQTIQE